MCVFVCVWSRCAWPPRTACCPSVLPSVCRLRPRSANSTTPWQEDPGERDAERRGEGWKESERWRVGGREGGARGVRLEGGAERGGRGGLQGRGIETKRKWEGVMVQDAVPTPRAWIHWGKVMACCWLCGRLVANTTFLLPLLPSTFSCF